MNATAAAAPAYEVSGSLVLAAREWLGPVSVLTFGLGAMHVLLGVLSNATRASVAVGIWGLVAVPMVMVRPSW